MKTTALLGSLALSLGLLAAPASAAPILLPAAPNAGGVVQGDPVLTALHALQRRAPSMATAELVHATTIPLGDGRRVVRFSQEHAGLPVIGRGAAVLLDASGAPTSFATARVESSLPADATPSIDASRAGVIATGFAGITLDKGRLAWWPGAGATRLAWTFYGGVVGGVPYAPVVVVDANSGEVLARYNAVRFDRQATVYEFNPVKTPTPISVTLDDLATGATALTGPHADIKNCIDTHATKVVYGLTMHTCELQQKAVADSNGDFPYTFSSDTDPEDAFAEVEMFYHVTKAYKFLQDLGMPDLLPKQMPAVVNLRIAAGLQTGFDTAKAADPNLPLEAFDNAFFSPADPLFSQVFSINSGAMWFGQGTAGDFSYDGDVVYHEFGHAMIDRTIQLVGTWHLDAQGAVDSPGAMNEGLADYFSSIITGDPQVGEYAGGGLGLGAIRDLDNPTTCPENLSGEVHSDSTFFSAALWKTRSTLSAADQHEYDKAMLAALIGASTGDVGYGDLAQLFIASLKASPLGQSVASALEQEMTARGVLPQCDRVIEWKGTPIKGSDPNLKSAFFAAGKSSAGVAQGDAYAPGLLQFHVPLGDNPTKLEMSWQDLQFQSGLGGALGGGTPATPKLLLRFDKDPIAFTYNAGVASNADPAVDPVKGTTTYSLSVDVPAGATDAYAMIVNAGDNDGGYTTVSFKVDNAPGGAGGAGGSAGAAGATGAAGAGADAATPAADDSGCGCRTTPTGHAPGAAGAFAALGLALLIGRRKRG